MSTVREQDRPRCTDRAHGDGHGHRMETLEAQGRALRTASLVLLLAFVMGLGATSLLESTPVEAETRPVGRDALHSVEFPIRVTDRVDYWMERYLTDQRAQFQLFLDREGIYADMIRRKLQARGMPSELLYLAAIESGFSPSATSRASAMGLWQFMGPTALDYGLRVDEWVDERRDPLRATDAALDYLEQLHSRFQSWYLAAAAYNAGPNRVARIVRRHAGDRWGEEDLFWEIVDHLPAETREYVPKLIAANLLAREADTFGFVNAEVDPYSFETVFVPGGTPLSKVASSLGLPRKALRDLNPHLIKGVTPPGVSYGLRVPRGTSQTVVASLSPRGSLARAD